MNFMCVPLDSSPAIKQKEEEAKLPKRLAYMPPNPRKLPPPPAPGCFPASGAGVRLLFGQPLWRRPKRQRETPQGNPFFWGLKGNQRGTKASTILEVPLCFPPIFGGSKEPFWRFARAWHWPPRFGHGNDIVASHPNGDVGLEAGP